MINKLFLKYSFCLIVVILMLNLNAQSPYQVTHITGTQIVNGISITVIHRGKIAILDDLSYCEGQTGPYYFGYSYLDGQSRNGSYSFTFDPPVKEITINITGLSGDNNNMEEVKFFINETHYPIPVIGTKISCEELAVLTPKGNVRPCRGCSISGWKGTKIEGPITNLTVSDSILSGDPAGSLIALYIGDPDLSNTIYSTINKIKMREVAAGKGIIIASNFFLNSSLTLKDKSENLVNFNYYQMDEQRICIEAKDIAKGIYVLEIKTGEEVDRQKLIIE